MENKVLTPVGVQKLRKKLMSVGMCLVISGALTIILGLVLFRTRQEHFGFIAIFGIIVNGLGAMFSGLIIRDDSFYYKDKNQMEAEDYD